MIPSLHGNWIDLAILVIVGFFIYQGLTNSFWGILIDFIAFLGSLLFSLKTYIFTSSFLQLNFSISKSLGNAIGFLFNAILIEIVLSYLLNYLILKLPQKVLKNKITSFLAVVLSVGQGIILISFILTLAIGLPINPSIKEDISHSKIGSLILNKTQGIENSINNIFGGAINDSLTYVTIEPKSHEALPLDNKTNNLTIDSISENRMFSLINNERTSRGLEALNWNTRLLQVARNYATFMWENHYFGHYDPQGKDVGDRLQAAGVYYTIAGENLALASTVEIAHTGLMNSPGHRANILEPKFSQVGIGVIDNNFYGKIFVQVFTN